MRATQHQNQADTKGKSFARKFKQLFAVDDPDGVVGCTNVPLLRYPQGYFMEVEVTQTASNVD